MEMMLNNNNTNNIGVGIIKEHKTWKLSEEAIQNKIKKINTSVENNVEYWNEFAKTRTSSSLPQYKSSIFRLINSVNKDLACITPNEIEDFTSKNKANKLYIKSILTYIYSNNIAGAKNNLTKEMKLYLLPEEYRGLI